MKNKTLSRKKQSLLLIPLLVLSLSVLQGCTNSFLRSVTSSSGTSTSVSSANPGSFNNTSGGLLTVVRAQKDNFDPSGTIALIGDGSGSMGAYCTAKSAGAGSKGTSTCTCSFSFTSSGSSQSFEVDTTYHESNLLRCPSTTIPSDVSTVNISVHLTAVDAFSNSVKFSISAGSNFNPLNADSFLAVRRIQCRDLVTAPYLFDPSVYDPVISEDPRYSQIYNFYTTNIGRTMGYYSGALATPSGIQLPTGFDCPVQQTDQPLKLDPYGGVATTISNNLNFKVFSIDANTSGSKLIYSSTTGAGPGFNRHDFVVAKAKSGVFTKPVDAYLFPGVFTQDAPSGVIPSLGYAASPVLSASGESCPDTSVSIPAGYHWAKLWLFRAQFAQRTFPRGDGLRALGDLACNPGGVWDSTKPDTVTNAIFPDCSTSIQTVASGNAARFSLATGWCLNINKGGAVSSSSLRAGSDLFTRQGADIGLFPIPGPPTNLGLSLVAAAASDTSGAVGAINGGINYDYLFTLSPPNVTRADMDESSSSNIHNIYTPVRFQMLSDCQSNDPSFPNFAGDCNPSRMIKYKIKKHGVGFGGNDATDPGDYPLCVLQKDN